MNQLEWQGDLKVFTNDLILRTSHLSFSRYMIQICTLWAVARHKYARITEFSGVLQFVLHDSLILQISSFDKYLLSSYSPFHVLLYQNCIVHLCLIPIFYLLQTPKFFLCNHWFCLSLLYIGIYKILCSALCSEMSTIGPVLSWFLVCWSWYIHYNVNFTVLVDRLFSLYYYLMETI